MSENTFFEPKGPLFLKDLLSKFGFITSFIMKYIGGSDSIDVGDIEEE